MEKKKGNLLSIHMLRGIAALIVVFHHTDFLMGNNQLGILSKILRQGWLGVDFFFVLSGFIIFYVNGKHFGKKDKIKEFFFKRFIRIYPIYWIVTIGVLAISFVVPNILTSYKLDFIVKSFVLFPQLDLPIVIVGWSLVYEVFFYLIFGVAIYLKPKYSKAVGIVWVTGILLNLFGFITIKDNLFLNFIFNNNNIQFIIGCIVAYIILNSKVKYNLSFMILGVIGFIIGWDLLVMGKLSRYSTESVLLLGVSFGLVVFATASYDLHLKTKTPKLLLLFGDASYSIYLTHYYIIGALLRMYSKIIILNPFIVFSLSSIIAVFLGISFHKIIEVPLLRYLNSRLLKKRIKSASASKAS